MNVIMMAITIIGFYFMFCPQAAYTRFKVSLRNQTKFLMCMFGLYGLVNLSRIFSAISLGLSFPFFALIMLGIDVYITKIYFDKL
jgi:hypothetical protein